MFQVQQANSLFERNAKVIFSGTNGHVAKRELGLACMLAVCLLSLSLPIASTLHARMHAVFFKRKHQSLRKVFMHVLHCCVGCPQSFGFSSSSFVFSLVCLLYIVVQRQDMILVWGGVAFIFASNECCSIITSGRRGKSNGFLYHRCWVEGRMLYQDLICTAV